MTLKLHVTPNRSVSISKPALQAPSVPTGPRFTPREVPGGDVQAFVSARFKGSDVNECPCRGEAILDLPADAVLARRYGETAEARA